MKKRFEEILEECLTAQLEGRRSVEQSLSQYPSMAPALEPLLRTAAGVSYAFEALDPPPYLQERGRLRFLSAASERRRAREIASGVRGFERSRSSWNFRHWGLLGSGVAAVFAILAAGGVLLAGGGGSDGGEQVAGSKSTPTASAPASDDFVANLDEFRIYLDQVKQKASNGSIKPEDIQGLREATERLAQAGAPPDDARQAVEDALNEQYVLLTSLSDDGPREQRDAVQEVLSVTTKAANDWEIPIFAATSTPTPTDQPVNTATPAPGTPEPTDAPTPGAPTDTPAPTAAPTPTPPLQSPE